MKRLILLGKTAPKTQQWTLSGVGGRAGRPFWPYRETPIEW